MSLPLDIIVINGSGLGVDGDLSGDEDEVSDCGDRGVGADGFGDACGEDSLNFIHKI